MAGEQVEFDESTTDPVALAVMFNQMETGGLDPADATPDDDAALAAAAEAAAVAAEAKVVADAAAAEASAAAAAVVDPDAAAAAAAPEKADAEPDGVATKDGKHIIPYAVLQAERERASTTAKELETARAELAALTAAKAGAPGVTPEIAAPDQPKAGDMSDEDLAVLKEDFPTVYNAMMAQRAQLAAMAARLKPVQETVEQQEAAHKRTVAEEVQSAIDATPKLALLKSSDPEQFALARQFDNMLKGQAAWQGKPLAERFAKVIQLVEQTNGEIAIPVAVKAPPAAKTPEQLKAEAVAIAAASAASTKTSVPTSLSDFPSGQHAAANEQEAAQNMTHAQLAAKFANMTTEQQDAYLNNL